MAYYARVYYPADSDGDTNFSVPFQYLNRAHVKVYHKLSTGLQFEDVYTEGVDYTWTSSSTIALTSARDSTTDILLKRETPVPPLATQQPGVISSPKINLNARQRQFLDEENLDEAAALRDRALLLPEGETSEGFPPPASRANKYMTFDADGQPSVAAGGADLFAFSVLGVAAGQPDMGDYDSPSVPDNRTAKQNIEDLAAAVERGAGPSVGNIHHRKIALQLPLFWPDYASLIAETGADWIYPSAFAIDEVAGQIFITGGYNNVVTHNLVWVHDWKTGAYISCFRVAYDGAAEGLEVVYDGATRYIYTANGTNIARYDITALPANKASPTATNFAVNLDTQFSYADGKWYVEQDESGVSDSSRTVFKVFGSDLATEIELKIFDIADVGFITTARPYGPFIPKKQGTAFGRSYVLTTHGGYIGNGDAVTGYAHQGTRVYNSKCEAVAESILDPQQMMDRLTAEGLTVSRIENEGIKILSDGSIYSLYVHRGRLEMPTTDGIVIFREFSADADAIDFTPDARVFNAVNTPQAVMRLGTGLSGKLVNPTTGEDFDTLDDVIGWMCDYRVRNIPVCFYTSSITISDYAGSLAGGILVRITGTNDSTFFVEYIGEDVSKSYAVVTDGGGVRSARSPIAQLITAVSLRLQSTMSDATTKLGRILGRHYTNAEEDILAIDIQGNSGSNNVMIGGGSGSYNAASTIRFFTAATTTTLAGTERARIETDGDFLIYGLASRNYANDAAAAAGGVRVGGLYRNGSVVMVRVV